MALETLPRNCISPTVSGLACSAPVGGDALAFDCLQVVQLLFAILDLASPRPALTLGMGGMGGSYLPMISTFSSVNMFVISMSFIIVLSLSDAYFASLSQCTVSEVRRRDESSPDAIEAITH
jgi:hypothetical protein